MSAQKRGRKDELQRLTPKKRLTPAEKRLMARLEAKQEDVFNELNAVLTKYRLGVSIKQVTFRRGKAKIHRAKEPDVVEARPCGYYVCLCTEEYGDICLYNGCP